MKFSDYLPIIFGVLKDIRVIGTVIAMFLVVAFAKYIINYTKKPKKIKEKKIKTPAPKAESDSAENSGGDAESSDAGDE